MADADDERCFLIIEDDPLSLKLYSDLVRSRGYQVITATDGQTGLELAREHHPDLVLSDLDLPGRSGTEICAALKLDHRTRDIPILIVTGWPDMETAVRCAGCDGFLRKPVSVSAFWLTIEALIRKRARNGNPTS